MIRLAWELEWAVALRRPRLFVLNVAVPLLLVAPVAWASAPPAHAAAVYAVLFALFGTFGTAIPLLRDGEEGILGRLLLTGLPPAALLLGRVAAGAALDTLQLLPAVAVIVLAGHADPASAGLLATALLVALLFANLLGAVVAGLARSVAEGALFAAVAALLLLHGAGTFRPPTPGSVAAALEPWVPFRPLHEHLVAVAGAGSAASASHLPGPLLTLGVAIGLAALAAGPLLGAVARTGRGE